MGRVRRPRQPGLRLPTRVPAPARPGAPGHRRRRGDSRTPTRLSRRFPMAQSQHRIASTVRKSLAVVLVLLALALAAFGPPALPGAHGGAGPAVAYADGGGNCPDGPFPPPDPNGA